MGIKEWFYPEPPSALVAGLMGAILTPIVQTGKHEFEEAVGAMSSKHSSGVIGILLMQVSLASALNTIKKKKPNRFSKGLYIFFEKVAFNTFDLQDKPKHFAAFQWLKKAISDSFGTDSVERANKATLVLLSLASSQQSEFTGNQVGATALAAIKVWEEAEKLADIAVSTCDLWKPITPYDKLLRSSSIVLVHAYRQIAEQANLAPTSKSSDYEIMETYTTVCTAFRSVAKDRGEEISAEQLNKIVLKFLQLREASGDELYIAHLEYEINLYQSSGLRPDYREGIKLF